MTTAAWPSTLGCATLGFTEQAQPNIAAFAPDVGPPKLRRRSTAKGVLTSLVFRMSNAQLVTFDTFYDTTLQDGTLPFTMNHPRTAVSYSWMFAPDEAPQKTRFAPNRSSVSFKLIRLPP